MFDLPKYPNRFTRVPDAPNGPDAGMAVWAYLEILGGIMSDRKTYAARRKVERARTQERRQARMRRTLETGRRYGR